MQRTNAGAWRWEFLGDTDEAIYTARVPAPNQKRTRKLGHGPCRGKPVWRVQEAKPGTRRAALMLACCCEVRSVQFGVRGPHVYLPFQEVQVKVSLRRVLQVCNSLQASNSPRLLSLAAPCLSCSSKLSLLALCRLNQAWLCLRFELCRNCRMVRRTRRTSFAR